MRDVSAILHAHTWPAPTRLDTLRARLREAAPDVEIIEAHEAATAAVGAAALINRAARTATGRILLVLEPTLLPDLAGLRTLIEAARDGLAIEHIPGTNTEPTQRIDLLAHLDSLLQRDRADARATPPDQPGRSAPARSALAPPVGSAPAAQPADGAALGGSLSRQPVWAVVRERFEGLGGLDERFWSVGVMEDLCARARVSGVAVRRVEVGVEWAGVVGYPLRGAVAGLLEVRNPLLTAFKTLPADRLGEALALAAGRAFWRGWLATGLSEETFQFGGSWGRGNAMWQRVTGGARLPVPLRDADGCLLPLLAIDSALDAFETLQRPVNLPDASGTASAEPEPEPKVPAASTAAATVGSTPATATDASGVPFVSVLIVNWNGREHLRDCFGSLLRSDYPADKLQLICVDNGSTDGSRELLRAEFPQVTVVALDSNHGFTGGNEAGVAVARGDVFVFLNNDMRVEPDCLRELVRGLDETSTCVGARVLSWDGRFIDFVRGSLNFEARGFQDFYGVRNLPELSTPTDTFFPNGGAFAVTREAYSRAGGFDPSFFAYYDDVDLGWRLRLTGAGIRVAGRAVVYHRHGATSRTQPKGQKRFLMERNALWTLMKNYGDRALRRSLGVILALAARRLLDETNINRRAPLARALAPFVQRCRRRGEKSWPAEVVYETSGNHVAAPLTPTLSPQAGRGRINRAEVGDLRARPLEGRSPSALRSMPLESLGATAAALAALPRIVSERAAVQHARLVPDVEILPRFGRNLEAVSSASSYKRLQHVLAEAHDLSELFRSRTRLLIIGHEAIARNMSGPAVRVLEMGRALSAVARVTIATPVAAEIEDARVTFATFQPADPGGLRRLAEDADVLLVQGFTLVQYPFLKALHIPVIVDLYCPFTLEHLEQTRARLAAAPTTAAAAAAAQQEAAGVLGVQNDQLRDGDFFLCASEAQRDFWIGALHSHGRINPLTYADDPTLRRLIDVVPFGLPEESASASAAQAETVAGEVGRPVMKGVRPGIGPDDRILLWAGSMLDWQDPLTLIRAVGELARRGNPTSAGAIKLFFMGTKHPNPLVSPMRVVEESRALARQLGLLDTYVFFNDWVPYEQRARYLVEADLGVSTHREHLETHFSFRTRMLDYIWAGLPIVCTRGDFFAGLVEARGVGLTVAPGDVAALSQALADLLDDPAKLSATRSRLGALREELRWSTVIAPLARYCAQPAFAADRALAMRAFRSRLEQQYRGSKWLKRTALRIGLSEYRIERLKQSGVGRAAMAAQSRLALHRARRSG